MIKRLYVWRMTERNKMGIERIDRVELMHTFVRIIESGSLSAAAQQMNTTQATVSRRLKSLEDLLGARLLLRTTHAMKLTDDGERCYQHARSVLASWQALEDEIKNAEGEPVGVLRVRAPHAFGQDQLIAPLTAFLNRYPGLCVDWMLNDKSPDFISDNIDCALHVGPDIDPSVIAVELAEVPRIVVASPELLARHRPSRILTASPRCRGWRSARFTGVKSHCIIPGAASGRRLRCCRGSVPTACTLSVARSLTGLAWG